MHVTRLSIVDLGFYSKTQTLLATLRIQNQLREESYGSLEAEFFHISWMCKKQTSISHCSTESEIISLDAGLRMDGLFALDLEDGAIEVFTFDKQKQKTNKNMFQETGAER